MSKNPTLFTLLKQGCTIHFRSGYILEGDPESGYINTQIEDASGFVNSDGLRILNEEGVRLALSDEIKYKRDLEHAN